MADNYLEKRFEEVFGKDAGKKAAPRRPSLDILLSKNRSFRGYDKSYIVHRRQLEAMVQTNAKLSSGMNAQRLRFRLVTKGPEADAVNSLIRLGAMLPELNLPFEGTEPEAFVVVCSIVAENPTVDIDLGISLQSMSLKAVEMGLGCVIVRNFKKEELKAALSLPLEPIAVLAVGKPLEKIEIVPVHDGDSLAYYRKDGVHYVPKLCLEDIMI